jgi:S1-C subfamily serine protease
VVAGVVGGLLATGLIAALTRKSPASTSGTGPPNPASASTPGTTRPQKTATPSPTRTSPTDFASIYQAESSGVVRIEVVGCGDAGIGTGFLLSPTLVATVDHVTTDSAVISLIDGGQRTTGTVIGNDPTQDLALIRASKALTGHALTLARSTPSVGSRVAAIGFPIGDPITLTVGDISGLDRNITIDGTGRSGLIETDTPLNPGNSGGPLLNLDGNVVGLVDAGRTGANGIAYAVPAAAAQVAFQQWQNTPQPVHPASCPNPLGPSAAASPNLPAPSDKGVADQDAEGVAAAFNTYFNGINTGNYSAAWAVLTPRLQGEMGYNHFQTGDSTTYDSAINVLAATDDGNGVVHVSLAFNSIQAPANGPNGEACDNWTLAYTLLKNPDSTWQIDATEPINGFTHTPC